MKIPGREIETELSCPICGTSVRHYGTCSTLLGYSSPEGHNHDDNCRKRLYECENGHNALLSVVNKCPACDWVGQKECFCSEKIDEWPRTAEDLIPFF